MRINCIIVNVDLKLILKITILPTFTKNIMVQHWANTELPTLKK